MPEYKDNLKEIMDGKESAEREEAAQRYFGESPKHFVDYVQESVNESKEGNRNARKMWDELWDAYEDKQRMAPDKEDWQSDVTTNKPFVTVQHAKSTIRRALSGSYRFYNLMAKRQYTNSQFAKEVMEFGKVLYDEFQGPEQADFVSAFIEACEMAFVIGQSFEMIPIWDRGQMSWELTPPWMIYRDPYANPRQPQSGNFWIREVWLDNWEMYQLEKRGIFKNVEEAMKTEKGTNDSNENKAQQEKKDSTVKSRNKYISEYKIYDFFGNIVSPRGELLLKDGRVSVCGDGLVRVPRRVPYDTIRWPGVSFSALPHLLNYDGRGLIEGVLSMWELFNNILNLHVDSLNWSINNMWERNIGRLIDEDDDEVYPGKMFDVKEGVSDSPVHRPLLTKPTTVEALANVEFFERQFGENSFVTDLIAGLPGYRSEITKGEYEGKTAASMGVFESMAKDLELGARQALRASYDLISLNIKRDHEVMKSVPEIKPDEEYNPEAVERLRNRLFEFRGKLFKYANLQVTGISNMVNKVELLQKLNDALMKADHPLLARYIKPYNLLKAYYEVIDLDKYEIVVDEEKAKEVDGRVEKQLQAQEIKFGAQGSSGSESA